MTETINPTRLLLKEAGDGGDGGPWATTLESPVELIKYIDSGPHSSIIGVQSEFPFLTNFPGNCSGV